MKPKTKCMMKHIGRYLAVMLCLMLAMSLLAGFMPGTMTTAKADGETTFNIAVSGNTFTVTRSGDISKAQTIRYRTVSLSALDGKNFTGVSGELTFAAGSQNADKSVTVTETAAASVPALYRYQNAENRSYRFEVLDMGGFELASVERNISYNNGTISSSAYEEKTITVQSSEITVTDKGFDKQTYYAVPISRYFSNSAPQDYLSASGAELLMTVELQAKEIDDGYQYIQILVNQTSNCDKGNDGGNTGTVSYSRYIAGFKHQGGSTNKNYALYSFPVLSVADGGSATKPWSGNTIGDLCQQNFNKKLNCRASDGRLIIPASLSSLGLRFDASGNNDDDWNAKSIVVKIEATSTPTVSLNDIKVSSGDLARGNRFYVAVPFNEIVNITSTNKPKLVTSWGTLNYIGGSGTNVLYFYGTVSNQPGTVLTITGMTGTNTTSTVVKDLEGHIFNWSGEKNTGISVAQDHTYTIEYDLAGGTVNGTNPSTYNYNSSTITLINPTRTGYTFTGWTGTDLNEPTTTVSFSRKNGNRSYTANWTPVTYTLTCDLQDGTLGDGESNPETYTIESNAITLVNPTRFGYNFTGWTGTGLNQATETVTIPQGSIGDRSYTANWSRIYHTVTLKNEDGTVFDSWHVAHGVRPNSHEAPVKTDTAQYTYTFSGWSDGTTLYGPEEQLPVCLADAEYTAVFKAMIRQYNVIWMNDDGALLNIVQLNYGETPVYSGEDPEKARTAQYTYTWSGWRDGANNYPLGEDGTAPVFPDVTGNTQYIATFTDTVNQYTVIFQNWDGTELQRDILNYGATPAYTGSTPQKQSDDDYTYTFDGWNTAIENVTGDAVYRAKYSPATRLYTVTLQQPANGTISIVGTTVNEFARGTRIKLAYSGDGTFGVQAWHVRTEDETDVELSVTGAGMYPAFIMPAQGITVSATMAPAKTLAIQARNQQNVLSNDKISICRTTVNGESTNRAFPAEGMNVPAAPGATVVMWIQSATDADIESLTLTCGENSRTIDLEKSGNFRYALFTMPDDNATATINTVDAAWGDNLTWSLSGGTLTIAGTGAMASADSASGYPWFAVRSQIKTIVIEEGVTSIAKNAFFFGNSSRVNNIWLPGTLTGIGIYAFSPGYVDVWYGGTQRNWNGISLGDSTTGYEWLITSAFHYRHTVQFVNTDETGTVLQSGPVYDGQRPEYTGETPTKAADAKNTYTFCAWWLDQEEYFAEGAVLAKVSAGDPETITYYPDYSSALRSYTISFLNWDGTEFQSPEVGYGSVPAAFGEPQKASDDDHSYDFAGWSDGTTTYDDDDELPAVTGPATYTAVFTPVARRYAIQSNSDSHSHVREIYSDNAHEMTRATAGTVIYVIPDADDGWGIASLRVIDADGNDVPIRMNEDTGFIPAYTMPAKDVTISVTSAAAKSITVTPVEYVNTVSVIVYGTDYDDPDPSTGNVTGAAAPGAHVTLMMIPDTWNYVAAGRITVTANGSSTSYQTHGVFIDGDYCRVVTFTMPNDDVAVTIQDAVIYNVSFENWDGTELTRAMVEENVIPVYLGARIPTRASTAQYTYTFSGWTDGTANYAADDTLPPVTADITYTATYSSAVRQYNVTFVDEDDTTILKAATAYDYGTARSEIALPADPTKDQDTQYTYTFAGWTPEISAVTANATYTATYTATPRLYTVTWVDGDGNTLKTESMEYGEWPEYSGNTPTKTATAQRVYAFNYSWEPDITEVTGDATYTAQFDEEIGLRVGDTDLTVPARDSISAFFIPEETGYYRISVLMNGEVTGFIGYIQLYSDTVWQGANNNPSYIFNSLIKLTAGELYHLSFESYSDEPVEPTVRIEQPEVYHVYVSSASRHAEIEPSFYTDYSGYSWTDVAEPGDQIYLCAYPEAGYSLTEWNVTRADGQPVEIRYEQGSHSYYPCFTMPAQDVTVGATVTQAETYPVNIRCRTGQYNNTDYLYVNGTYSELNNEAPAGARVTQILHMYSYYQQTIKNFTVTGQSGDVPCTVEQTEPNEYDEIYWYITFTMPDEPVTVWMDVKKANLPEVDTVLRTGANTVTLSPWPETDGYAVAYGSFTPEVSGVYQFTVTGVSENGSRLAFQREQEYCEDGWVYLEYQNDDTVSVRAGETLLFRLHDDDEVTNLTLTITRTGDVDELHTISVDPGITHGTVTPNSTEAERGEPVILYPVPESGYILSGQTVTTADGETVEVSGWMGYGFYMPDSNVTVFATFAQAYPVTVMNSHAETKRMYVTTPDFDFLYAMYTNVSQYQAFPGSTAYLTFDIDEGYRLTGVTVTAADGTPVECLFNQGDASAALFTMPGKPVTVTVETALDTAETLNLGVNANPKAGWYLFTPAESGEYTFAFEGNHTLSVYDTEGNFQSYVGTWYDSSISLAGGRTWLVRVSHDVLGDDGNYYLGSDLTITRTGNAKGIYSVTVDPAVSGGTVTPNYPQVMPDEWIALNVTPNAGYRLDSLAVTAGSRTLDTAEENGVYWFRMPDSDVNVSAVFVLDQVPEFGPAAFILPAQLTTIEESAFEGMTSMTIVDASNCTSIGKDAFKGCTDLTQIKLPKDCEINPAAFDHPVYVFAPDGGTTKDACDEQDNLIFAGKIVVK